MIIPLLHLTRSLILIIITMTIMIMITTVMSITLVMKLFLMLMLVTMIIIVLLLAITDLVANLLFFLRRKRIFVLQKSLFCKNPSFLPKHYLFSLLILENYFFNYMPKIPQEPPPSYSFKLLTSFHVKIHSSMTKYNNIITVS